jgi:hypothetical protein
MEEQPGTPRPKYRRAEKPPGMRFQERDGQILQTLYDYDGVLARRHLKEMFWPKASWRAMEMRLSVLYHNSYLNWPSKEQWRTKPISEPVCWLGWKGILRVAEKRGLYIDEPAKVNETWLRKLERTLRQAGVRWQREPRWSQLAHDLAVVDFRLAVERDAGELPDISLEAWIPEGEFQSTMDVVEYEMKGKDGRVRQKKKGVRPDGFFLVSDEARRSRGEAFNARFLVEVDMGTHDNPSFGNEKAAPGAAYIQSPVYKARFGDNSGRWLVVTTGRIRMKNMMQQTEQTGSAWAFLFTIFDQLETGNLFSAPFWWQAGKEGPVTLFPGK